MRAPDFWWRPPGLASALLSPAALLYGTVAARRLARPGARAAVPVVCVGNVAVGGAGKTPTALAIARLLSEAGERPAFLTRGYGGSLPGPVQVDPSRHTSREVGDEALLLARAAPTVVAVDRPSGAGLCAALGASVIVMDDGLQNPSLAKDLRLAVFDAGVGIGNGACLPAGPLRAPIARQWPIIDAIVMVGHGRPAEAVVAEAQRRGIPVLGAVLEPDQAAAGRIRDRRVLAFAGIGRPQKFYDTVEACGAILVEKVSFPDHHAYSAADLKGLLAWARAAELVPVTTEKDRVKLAPLVAASDLGAIAVLPVELAFADPAAVSDLLGKALARSRSLLAGSG